MTQRLDTAARPINARHTAAAASQTHATTAAAGLHRINILNTQPLVEARSVGRSVGRAAAAVSTRLQTAAALLSVTPALHSTPQ